MLADDAIGHEEAETSTRLFGREVRLKEVMAVLVGNTRTIVRDAAIRGPVAATSGFQVDPSLLWSSVDCVIEQVGDDFAKQQRVCSDFDIFWRFSESELYFFRPRPWSRHIQRPRGELVEIDRLGRVADSRRRPL